MIGVAASRKPPDRRQRHGNERQKSNGANRLHSVIHNATFSHCAGGINAVVALVTTFARNLTICTLDAAADSAGRA